MPHTKYRMTRSGYGDVAVGFVGGFCVTFWLAVLEVITGDYTDAQFLALASASCLGAAICAGALAIRRGGE